MADHTVRQAMHGEFSPLREQAKRLGPLAFARAHGTFPWLWGIKLSYVAVTVDGTEYLWVRETGEFDGWDRGLEPSPKRRLRRLWRTLRWAWWHGGME